MGKQGFDCKRQGKLMGMNKKCIKNKKLSKIQRGLEARQIDKMYYKIILARDSITIQSSSNVGIK
jgi:hypothetical protein